MIAQLTVQQLALHGAEVAPKENQSSRVTDPLHKLKTSLVAKCQELKKVTFSGLKTFT